MRRVVGRDLEPTSCLVSAIMTSKLYCAKLDTTILETLHFMHKDKFLHVPVVNQDNKLVGLADVLQVTRGIVQQLGIFQRARNESAQPLWTEYRTTMLHSEESGDGDADVDNDGDQEVDNDVTSGSDSRQVRPSALSTVADWHTFSKSTDEPLVDSIDPENPVEEATPDVFVYKLADCYGNNHRFTSSAESVKDLLRDVQNRLGDHTIQQVHYVDDESDHVRPPLFVCTSLAIGSR